MSKATEAEQMIIMQLDVVRHFLFAQQTMLEAIVLALVPGSEQEVKGIASRVRAMQSTMTEAQKEWVGGS